MASDYGLNFGWRRSDETYRVAEGRHRTPKTGAVLLQGTCVTIDPANPGYLMVAPANAPAVTGVTGVLLQEESHFFSIYEVESTTSFRLGITKPNTLSVITNGAGAKVWFRNTTAKTQIDGHAVPGVTLVTFPAGGINVGDLLGWDGTRWVVTTDEAAAHFTVTEVDNAKQYLEAVFVK